MIIVGSSRCESNFKDLKASDLGSNYQAMRADNIIAKHKLEKATGKQTLEAYTRVKMILRKATNV